MGENYVINENGEIIRGDYFATTVKEEKQQHQQGNAPYDESVILRRLAYPAATAEGHHIDASAEKCA